MAIAGMHRRRVENEGESVFVSMTDLTISFLFILLVLLAFFATQIHREEMVPVRDHADLTARLANAEVRAMQAEEEKARLEADHHRLNEAVAAETRLSSYFERATPVLQALLDKLAERIRNEVPEVEVSVDRVHGIIRFRGDRMFPSGTWRIPEGSPAERVAHAVGDALAEFLPCYTDAPGLDRGRSCADSTVAIETVQIEGHTDDNILGPELRYMENMIDNYDLSARRGAETLRVMTRRRQELSDFRNLSGQPVLSFAGYGETRPINPSDSDEARAQNRRIDIRFILQTPRSPGDIADIRSWLARSRAGSRGTVE